MHFRNLKHRNLSRLILSRSVQMLCGFHRSLTTSPSHRSPRTNRTRARLFRDMDGTSVSDGSQLSCDGPKALVSWLFSPRTNPSKPGVSQNKTWNKCFILVNPRRTKLLCSRKVGMKKNYQPSKQLLVVAVLTTIGIVGCGDSGDSSNSDTNTAAPDTTAQSQPESADDSTPNSAPTTVNNG